MPRKDAKKAATEAKPKTKTNGDAAKVVKKVKPVPVFTSVAKEAGAAAVQVEVTYEGTVATAKPGGKAGHYVHSMKLEALAPFTVTKTVVFPEDHEWFGLQAILIRPAKPFDFVKLPVEVRNRIYRYYFAGNRVVDSTIVLDGKRPSNKDVFAKTYAEGCKNRVALLATSKETNREAGDVFYASTFKFESMPVLSEFLTLIPPRVRALLQIIEIKQYSKNNSRTAMQSLAEAESLLKLHIEQGIATDGDPFKVAKSFYMDAGKFLNALRAVKGNKEDAIAVLSFGPKAFVEKDDGKGKTGTKPWSEQNLADFKVALAGKLK